MPATPFPNPDVGNLTSFFTYYNTTTNSLFGILALIVAYIVIFIGFAQYTRDRAFASTNFIILIFAILFQAMGLVGYYAVLVMAALTVVGAASLFLTKRQPPERA